MSFQSSVAIYILLEVTSVCIVENVEKKPIFLKNKRFWPENLQR